MLKEETASRGTELFTSSPMLNSKNTTPNSAMAFVPCTLRMMESPYGPMRTPAARYPRTGLPKISR